MYRPIPPLNALRAFEAAARHLSLTKAAQELHVTAGALSHQIRALEELLGVQLFERRVRSIALTPTGKQLHPGLQSGFQQIRDAVAGLDAGRNERVLVISTSPGLTSKWLAPRLYRFADAHPDIDTRISSSFTNVNFAADGIDVAVRNTAIDAEPDPALTMERLIDLSFIAVCSPRVIEKYGPLNSPQALARMPLIHDDALASRVQVPTWADWFAAAGVESVDVGRGLRFNSSDHALDAAGEGAGVLLALDLLAYDDLRTGRLVVPVTFSLPSGRCFQIVGPRSRRERPHVQAFRAWIKQEIAAMDWNATRAKSLRASPAG